MTSNVPQFCLIWGEGFAAEMVEFGLGIPPKVADSPRAGGGYTLGYWDPFLPIALDPIGGMTDAEKAKLTTWLVDQRLQGNTQPLITRAVIDYAKRQNPLPLPERADRLFRFIAKQSLPRFIAHWSEPIRTWSEPIRTRVESNGSNLFRSLAWSESVSVSEVSYLMNYLKERNWLIGSVHDDGSFSVEVTADGFSRFVNQAMKVDLAQVFVARWYDDPMQFEPCMVEAYDGIGNAIYEAGYKDLWIDQGLGNDKIIDEMRCAKFLVADFTQDADGARGEVYYEVGLAEGLGLEVIFTCRKDAIDKVHFDVDNHGTVVWATPAELHKVLRDLILMVFGRGPYR